MMRRTRTPLLLLILFSALLAGCMQPEASDSPRFGLGLDTSNPPPPGRFLEAEADIERLAQFLESWGRDMLKRCETTDSSGFESLMRDKLYLGALNSVYGQCEDFRGTEAQLAAQRDHAAGTAENQIRLMKVEQHAFLNETIGLITAANWTANPLDIELLGWLMRKVEWVNASFGLGLEIADEYLASPDSRMIGSVYLNLLNPEHHAFPAREFLQHFPWAGEPCEADNERITQIFSETNALLETTIAKAEALRDPDERINLSTNYGRLTLDFMPAMEFVENLGWWPATLWYEAVVNWSSSGWDHHNDPVLPTQEEAMYLVAQYMNRSRSLMTDDQAAILQSNIPYRDWEKEAIFPNMVITLPAFQWTYGKLPCQGP